MLDVAGRNDWVSGGYSEGETKIPFGLRGPMPQVGAKAVKHWRVGKLHCVISPFFSPCPYIPERSLRNFTQEEEGEMISEDSYKKEKINRMAEGV